MGRSLNGQVFMVMYCADRGGEEQGGAGVSRETCQRGGRGQLITPRTVAKAA